MSTNLGKACSCGGVVKVPERKFPLIYIQHTKGGHDISVKISVVTLSRLQGSASNQSTAAWDLPNMWPHTKYWRKMKENIVFYQDMETDVS